MWQDVLTNQQERLRKPDIWYPYPALISIGLIFVLSGHLLPGLNPRLGSMANIIVFPAKPEPEGSIWIGLFAEGDQVVAVTADRKRFTWPLSTSSVQSIKEFASYLDNRVVSESVASGLSMRTSATRTKVIFAVDQRLKFKHFRPALNALAQAKITKYGFETRILRE